VIDWATRRKVFVYVTRITNEAWELLVFDSLHEPGFEVPKGAVEGGEPLEEAVHRELLEEAGITDSRIIRELGAADWGDERQHFFLVEPPPGLPRSFDHTVTGNGVDAGLRYRFRWLSIAPELRRRLVQGSDRFVDELLAAFGAG
jgi:8-oxo-dGTP pyrophosphatase MutT (NUDIX family)